VSDWKGRESIRENLRQFVDKQMTAYHEVVEFWDGGQLKVFRGFVNMKFDDPSRKPVRPAMTHFFCMDAKNPEKGRPMLRIGRADRILKIAENKGPEPVEFGPIPLRYEGQL